MWSKAEESRDTEVARMVKSLGHRWLDTEGMTLVAILLR
jgi:hypothetical protein